MNIDCALYTDIKNTLWSSQVVRSPSEIHGELTASICLGTQADDIVDWACDALEIDQDLEEYSHQQLEPLEKLYNLTVSQLKNMEFDFQLLLPDEEEEGISESLRELKNWCTGFMNEMESDENAQASLEKLSQESGDVISRFREVIEVDEDVANTEENLAAFVELVEFIRMGVLLIYMELAGAQKTPRNSNNTLH